MAATKEKEKRKRGEGGETISTEGEEQTGEEGAETRTFNVDKLKAETKTPFRTVQPVASIVSYKVVVL